MEKQQTKNDEGVDEVSDVTKCFLAIVGLLAIFVAGCFYVIAPSFRSTKEEVTFDPPESPFKMVSELEVGESGYFLLDAYDPQTNSVRDAKVFPRCSSIRYGYIERQESRLFYVTDARPDVNGVYDNVQLRRHHIHCWHVVDPGVGCKKRYADGPCCPAKKDPSREIKAYPLNESDLNDPVPLVPSATSFTVSSLAGPTEAEECHRLAPKYKVPEDGIEYRLWDGTRVDLLSDEYAIEADWAATGKHFEAIGQALYYALVTGKKPAIILLVKDRDRDAKYVYRTQAVCAKYGITLFVEDSE